MPVAILDAKIELAGPLAAALSKSAFNQILKTSYLAMGHHWRSKILPKHFTEAGAAEYNYRPRSPEYVRRKRRKFGHNRPLVFYGQLAGGLLALSGARISSTSKSCTIRLKLHGYRLKTKTIIKELTAVSAADVRSCARFLETAVAKRLAKIKLRSVVRT